MKKLVIIIVIILVAIVGVTAYLNRENLADKDVLQEKALIIIKDDGKEVERIDFDFVKKQGELTFNKELDTSDSGPREHSYTGVPLKNIITGEVLNTGKKLFLDEAKIKQDEQLDGYYAIVTSELDHSDERIIDIYRGLWRIEESFKITKSTLAARPVYLSRKDHINAHFFICFICLVMARIVEISLNHKYSIEKILNSLRSVSCSHIDANHYLFDYADEVTDDINDVFNLNIGQKVMTLGEIKKNFGMVKKR